MEHQFENTLTIAMATGAIATLATYHVTQGLLSTLTKWHAVSLAILVTAMIIYSHALDEIFIMYDELTLKEPEVMQ